MNEIELISIWKASKSAGAYIGHHSHKYHELVYYPVAHGLTEIAGETHAISDNSFAIISPNEPHSESHISRGEVICLEISGAYDLHTGLFYDPELKVLRVLRELLDEVRLQKNGYREMIKIKLNELILIINRIYGSHTGEKSFEYVINYLRENYHERIILADCARQIDLSYDYFQHKFKSITGMSPQQFLIEQRLTAGASMLKSGEFNCTEIAFRCGFSTSAQFSALFKQKYGITPHKYKVAHRVENEN